jgi:3-oxoacyl-[acyl-carrier protein] reductase
MSDYLDRMFNLCGRRAVITGASRGIGRALAQALAGGGAEVLVHYNRSADAAAQVVSEITEAGGKAWLAQADLTDPEQVRRLFAEVEQKWSSLDILINNAGDLVKRCKIEDFSDDLLRQVIDVNISSTVYATRQAIPLLRRGTDPNIINISSIAAHTGGAIGGSIYAATKGAILTFTRGLAREMAPHIRVNAIAPGTIMTDFQRKHTSPEALENIKRNTFQQRLGLPEDHATAVIFLAGPGASFITGEMIEINGGLWVA